MQEVESLVNAFETRTISPSEWDHQMHLAVCCWYVMNGFDDVEHRMREGIRSLNREHGVIETASSGYHETLTLFWIAKVRSLVEVCCGPAIVVVGAVVGGLADPTLVYFHYSRERIASSEARKTWCAPDLHRLPAEGSEMWLSPWQLAS